MRGGRGRGGEPVFYSQLLLGVEVHFCQLTRFTSLLLLLLLHL